MTTVPACWGRGLVAICSLALVQPVVAFGALIFRRVLLVGLSYSLSGSLDVSGSERSDRSYVACRSRGFGETLERSMAAIAVVLRCTLATFLAHVGADQAKPMIAPIVALNGEFLAVEDWRIRSA